MSLTPAYKILTAGYISNFFHCSRHTTNPYLELVLQPASYVNITWNATPAQFVANYQFFYKDIYDWKIYPVGMTDLLVEHVPAMDKIYLWSDFWGCSSKTGRVTNAGALLLPCFRRKTPYIHFDVVGQLLRARTALRWDCICQKFKLGRKLEGFIIRKNNLA